MVLAQIAQIAIQLLDALFVRLRSLSLEPLVESSSAALLVPELGVGFLALACGLGGIARGVALRERCILFFGSGGMLAFVGILCLGVIAGVVGVCILRGFGIRGVWPLLFLLSVLGFRNLGV